MLRRVRDSLPSSVATLIRSACSGVTSNVTVRPKLLPAPLGFVSGASIASTRKFSTIVSLTERRVSGGSFLNALSEDHIDPVARMQQAGAGSACGHRDRDCARPGRKHNLQKIAVARLDNCVSGNRLAGLDPVRSAAHTPRPALADRARGWDCRRDHGAA